SYLLGAYTPAMPAKRVAQPRTGGTAAVPPASPAAPLRHSRSVVIRRPAPTTTAGAARSARPGRGLPPTYRGTATWPPIERLVSAALWLDAGTCRRSTTPLSIAPPSPPPTASRPNEVLKILTLPLGPCRIAAYHSIRLDRSVLHVTTA